MYVVTMVIIKQIICVAATLIILEMFIFSEKEAF